MHRRLLPVALAAVSACHSTIYDAVDPEVRVETPVVWAGADIVLTSASFTGVDTLPLVLVGDDTLTPRYAPPDSLRVAAPDSQGTYEVRVWFRARPLPLPYGAITVQGGYSGYRDVPSIGGYPLLWPGGGLPKFLIGVPDGLALVDPRSSTTVRVLPDSIFDQYCFNGPGPAPDGRVTVSRSLPNWECGPLVSVQLANPTLAPAPGPRRCTGCRFAAQLGPDRWLVFFHHGFESWYRDSTGAWTGTLYWYGEPHDVAVSRRVDRAVPLGANSRGLGTPVFTSASAGPAYVLSQFGEVSAAQFTDDGDTLYVVAWPADTAGGAGPLLAVLRAADGAVLRSAPAWGGDHLVLDPVRPFLYLAGYEGSWYQAVQVVDRATLKPVTTLRAPDDLRSPGNLYPMLSAAERKLYLVDTCPWCLAGYSARIFAFDLLR